MDDDRNESERPAGGPPPGLPARLLARAAERPEEPWLFFQEGWHWRWRSWRRVAAAVERLTEELRELATAAGVAPGARIGFAGTMRVEAVALDLALQAGGFAAAPLPAAGAAGGPENLGRKAEALGCAALAAIAGDESGGGGGGAGGGEPRPPGSRPASRLPVLLLPPTGLATGGQLTTSRQRPTGGRLTAAAPASSGGPSTAAATPGPVVVREREVPRQIDQEELAARVADLEARLPPRRGRDVLVLAGGLADPPTRLLLAWALTVGAAVVLEPEPADLVATAAWVRPTLFAGDAAQRAALGDRLAASRRRGLLDRLRLRRRPRPPLGRLHAVVATDPAPTAGAERAAWTSLGVALLKRPVV